MKGRLNLFQATMVRWRSLHPYNAIHAIRIPGPADLSRLRATISETLEALGLTGLVFDAARGRYDYAGGPARFELATLEAGDDAGGALAREFERQLNRPFPADGPLEPFRFFVLDEGHGFRLGLAYDHFVAAGDSIVSLMRMLADHYAGVRAAPVALAERYPPRCRSLLLRDAGSLVHGFPRIPEMAASCRRGVRPRYRDPAVGEMGFAYARLGVDTAVRLRQAARRFGVTFNDLLLALTLAALDSCVGPRKPGERRNEIGVASIVNIRREFGPRVEHAFGQFLSSFRVSHPVPPGVSIESLARDVHRQTVEIKERKLYLQNLVAMGATGLYWRLLSRERRAALHAKSYPTWAGVSWLDIEALWRAGGGGHAPEYVRGVPCGPLSPIVLAVTTDGHALHLGISYRTAAVDRDGIARISSLFNELANRLAA